jgi:hypothetical protein
MQAALALLWSTALVNLPATTHRYSRSVPRCRNVRADLDEALEDLLTTARLTTGGRSNDDDGLEVLLQELENVRDWVSADIADAAMMKVREKRSLDAFIQSLQDEVNNLGDQIAGDIDVAEQAFGEQADATAHEQRSEMAARAEELLEELEASAPAAFKNRASSSKPPPRKSPSLPRGARVVVAGVQDSAFGQTLTENLENQLGYNVSLGPATCPAGCADATLPPSGTLRRALASTDALVLVCAGAANGGVSPTYVNGAARVLPASLRRVLLIAPFGVDRTFELPYALRNALGALDRQRGAEQRMASEAEAVGAAITIMRVQVDDETVAAPGAARTATATRAGQVPGSGIRIAAGDVLRGSLTASVVVRAVRESLRRKEAEGARFSLSAGSSGEWDDEFLKLVGPEVARFSTRTPVPVDWVRKWARTLEPGILASGYTVYDLPTRASAAAARTLSIPLGTGARIHFLASGVEFVGDDEEERVKGDFDGALDILIEQRGGQSRVRVVRGEMEPVWRKLGNGGRRQVAPLVKVTSEARLLERLAADLASDEARGGAGR